MLESFSGAGVWARATLDGYLGGLIGWDCTVHLYISVVISGRRAERVISIGERASGYSKNTMAGTSHHAELQIISRVKRVLHSAASAKPSNGSRLDQCDGG